MIPCHIFAGQHVIHINDNSAVRCEVPIAYYLCRFILQWVAYCDIEFPRIRDVAVGYSHGHCVDFAFGTCYSIHIYCVIFIAIIIVSIMPYAKVVAALRGIRYFNTIRPRHIAVFVQGCKHGDIIRSIGVNCRIGVDDVPIYIWCGSAHVTIFYFNSNLNNYRLSSFVRARRYCICITRSRSQGFNYDFMAVDFAA